MKIFVINLDKNTERLAKFDAQMRQYELPYERIRAIYGKELSSAEKRAKVNRFAAWCIRGFTMRDGELGAALSHQLAYRNMIAENIPLACVFEDDVAMDRRICNQLKQVESWICPTKPQVVLLSNYTSEVSNNWEIVGCSGDSSAEAYVITRPAAEMIIKQNYPVCVPSDLWGYWHRHGLLEIYHAFPAVIHPAWRQDPNYQSEVTPTLVGVVDVRKMSAVGKMLWKINRIVGMALEMLIIRRHKI